MAPPALSDSDDSPPPSSPNANHDDEEVDVVLKPLGSKDRSILEGIENSLDRALGDEAFRKRDNNKGSVVREKQQTEDLKNRIQDLKREEVSFAHIDLGFGLFFDEL